ncbi:MAG: iron hydrogenase small subunit [Deltaproteobacteria bacterium]|jgi:hypothetical protein|nr:iron hydrogenase small subunit [Deltaproteobacteria bacterium]
MFAISRRVILKGGLALGGAALLGLRFASAATAQVKELKEYMLDRINSVYKTDKAFSARSSRQNKQVQELYKNFLGEPGGELSHRYLHMHFRDRSRKIKTLEAAGNYPNPRASEFEGNDYFYE